MLDCFSLAGKVVFITGGSMGLGRGMARACADAGAAVSVMARREEKLIQEQVEFEQKGYKFLYTVGDVTKVNDVQEAVDNTIAEFGHIDCLINNCGSGTHRTLFENVPRAEWDRLINFNLSSQFIVSQIVVREMIKAGKGGSIVNIASIAAQIPGKRRVPGVVTNDVKSAGAYEAAKEGVKGLTRAMAADWAPYNIRVNSISPGIFLSEVNAATAFMNHSDIDASAQSVLLKRWGIPDEIGPLAVMLCSDASSYMTGSNCTIDGGRTFV